MKRYKVYVYNTVDKFWDCYEVLAEDPVDARNVAVQRLIDETGHGLDLRRSPGSVRPGWAVLRAGAVRYGERCQVGGIPCGTDLPGAV